MTNPTTPFSWQMPTSTDLVTDLPADFETFGQAVATSMADLLGGTTGQILSKASNTDMDFTWTSANPGDITGVTAGTGISGGGTSGDVTITNSMATAIDAKGDLIGGTGADTFSRLAVGTNGQVLTADSTAATGLAWATPSTPSNLFYAGKNKIINGDFYWNQRNFTSITTGNYNFDRFYTSNSGGTVTTSAQTFTPGTAPVAGYEGKNYLRVVTSGQSAAGDFAAPAQRIESVRTFAGQTVTFSFWAKANTGTPQITLELFQIFGTGGSPSSAVILTGQNKTLSTSWTRYSATFSVPSISGKTIGTNNDDYLAVNVWLSAGSTYSSRSSIGVQNNTFELWGWQVEAGSSATDFQTATGTLQGELAACQRYYFRSTPGTNYGGHGAYGSARTTTVVKAPIPFPVEMRVIPTSVDYSNLAVNDGQTIIAVTTVALSGYESKVVAYPEFTVGSASLTQYRPYHVNNNNNTAAYLGFSAEL